MSFVSVSASAGLGVLRRCDGCGEEETGGGMSYFTDVVCAEGRSDQEPRTQGARSGWLEPGAGRMDRGARRRAVGAGRMELGARSKE